MSIGQDLNRRNALVNIPSLAVRLNVRARRVDILGLMRLPGPQGRPVNRRLQKLGRSPEV